MTDRIGQQLGNYRLIGLLGRGGFADTYLGEHTFLKTFAAIKVLQTQLQRSDQESFYNEARTIAHLKHLNIVRVLEFGVEKDSNTPYLIMDYAPNGTIRQLYHRGVIVPSSTVISYVTQIASALYYAHSQKVVHRDVKPENILLGGNSEALLSDFGIAVVSQNTYTQNSQNIAGTVTYMAPEQIQGKARAASDQYALGVVVYEWLCGVVPFSGTYIEVAIQHERVAPTPLRKHVPTISSDVEQVVLTALEKDPQKRFGSTQAFANALVQASGEARAAQSHSQSQGVSVPMQAIGDSQWTKPTQIAPLASIGYGTQGIDVPRLTPPFSQENNPTQLAPSGAQGIDAPRLTPPFSQENYAPRLIPSGTQPVLPPVNQSAYGPQVINPQHNYMQPPPPPPMPAGPGFTQQARQTSLPVTPLPNVAPLNLNRSNLFSTRVRVLLILLVLLLIAAGSGIVYYANVYQPNQMHIQATAVAVGHATGTAQAQLHATATGVAQSTAVAIATAGARQDIYNQATNGTPLISVSLKGGDNYGWDRYTTSTNKCDFVGGVYHSRAQVGYSSPCYAEATNFSDLALQVETTVISGTSTGIAFRVTPNTYSPAYQFYINTDGTYNLYKTTPTKDNSYQFTPLVSGSSSAIHTELNQMNLLTAIARGSTLYFYVNKQYVNTVSDSTSKAGLIGMVVSSGNTSGTEATFRNLQVWQL